MSLLDNIHKIYFIGIGGIGMSALARYFHLRGAVVSGYDKTATALTKELETEGINIHYEENVNIIPKDVDVVVYTPAIPSSHTELEYYRSGEYKVVKRSDVLQWITEHSFNICVAGTHGKTTITTMIGHILRDSGYGCSAFIGGISVNYGSNFWYNERNVIVVEADEYDRSFLKLKPDVAVISSMDADHLDIYGTKEELEKAFVQFSRCIKEGGCIVSKYGLQRDSELQGATHHRYHLQNNNASVYTTNLRVHKGAYIYDVISPEWLLKDMILHVGGLYNVENSIAAITVAKHIGIEEEKIKQALASFKGVKRRFEYYIKEDDTVLIDDYAHHPEELKALLNGVRSLYGSKKCTIIFQPHLYSRTKDFAKDFAASLDIADEIILLPIYPARELPIEGVTSELITGYMKNENKKNLSKEAMIEWVKQEKPSLVIMAGAGDIDILVDKVKNVMKN